MRSSLPTVGDSSLLKMVEPSLLLQCQARSRASYSGAREREGLDHYGPQITAQMLLITLYDNMDIIMTSAGPEIRTQTCPWEQLGTCHYHGPGGSTEHPNQYVPRGSKALGDQHGLRWLSRPPASTQPSVPTGAWTSTQILAPARPQESSPHMTKSNYSEPHLVPLSEWPMIDNCAKDNCHHVMT